MAPQDESPTVQVEETQYGASKEPYVQASQPNVNNNESPPAAQKVQQLMTPTTPRNGPGRTQTPPVGPAPSQLSQLPDPQIPSEKSEDSSTENLDEGPKEEHPGDEEIEPHTLPVFD
ncbi:hypothetical protein V498_10134 [Pseudogymnoascus sp. VKM F-4517 (FW-2822)]|nr:hypothetical protein V498_10134 [Pseudogymnoascus sp. VKM F-4517 (FW-2822)]